MLDFLDGFVARRFNQQVILVAAACNAIVVMIVSLFTWVFDPVSVGAWFVS